MSDADLQRAADAIARRAEESFDAQRRALYFRTNKLFSWVLLAQWALSIALSIFASPLAWEGRTSVVHPHLYYAVGLGALITLPPMLLGQFRAGDTVTRYVITIALVLQACLIIHLLGGRIEAHFSLFMLAAWITFYRDWRLSILAVIVAGTDHVVRALFWPESIFGSASMIELRVIEHAAWLTWGTVLYLVHIRDSVRDMRATAEGNAQIEALAEGEWRRSSVLERGASEGPTDG